MTVGIVLGSAFSATQIGERRELSTPFGPAVLHEHYGGYLLFRHGAPYERLPHQINYRSNAWALHHVGVNRLVVTSSVGVMDAQVPLDELLLLGDLLMLENSLPDGRACSMWDQGGSHLVIRDGIFNTALSAAVGEVANVQAAPVVFTYVGGPRTKTPAENRFLATTGAQVNSMTVGPEVVLANELEISCAGLVIGHKYSHPDIENPDTEGVTDSLTRSRMAVEPLLHGLLTGLPEVEFGNEIYRFSDNSK